MRFFYIPDTRSSSIDVEVMNYTGLPLPAPIGQNITVTLKVTGHGASEWRNVTCRWELLGRNTECYRVPDDTGEFLIDVMAKTALNQTPGVYVLTVYEVPKQEVIGVSKFNASVNIGSNQFNEWILPNAFCYGQTVDLNFASGYFVLFSSNGVKTVVQTFLKHADKVTTLAPNSKQTKIRPKLWKPTKEGWSSTDSQLHTITSLGFPKKTPLPLLQNASFEASSVSEIPQTTTSQTSQTTYTTLVKTNPTTPQPRRNTKFPAVELYSANNTKSNVTSYFFIVSNYRDKIQICINFGDGTEKTLNLTQSTTITHVYNKTGNMTVKLSVFLRNKEELSIFRYIMVLNHHCFQSTPMFDIRNSVPSNPLTVFLFSEIIIKSRKQYDHQSDRCNTDFRGQLTYIWTVTNTETGEETVSTRNQLSLPSHTPGLFKVSLEMHAEQFSTTGILYIKFIFKHRINFNKNILCQFVPYRMGNNNVDAAIWPHKYLMLRPKSKMVSLVTNLQHSRFLQKGGYSNLSLIPEKYEATKWINLFSLNSTFLPFNIHAQGKDRDRGLTEITLSVNYTSSVENIYQFVVVSDLQCNVNYSCVRNCEIRTSLSQEYEVRMNSMNGSCISRPELQGLYNVSYGTNNESALHMIERHFLINGSSFIHIVRDLIIVQTNRLTAGKRYMLKMTTGNVPWFIYLHMNRPPTGGDCEVMPKEGLVLRTEFMVVCRGWRAGGEDYNTPQQQTKVPLLYTVRYRTSGGGHVMVYQGFEESTPPYMLPSGGAAQNYRVTVEIEVKDRFNDKAQKNISVTVKGEDDKYNRETYIETLCRNLLTKLKFSQHPDTQIHAIHITASELSRVLTNVSFPSMNISEMMNTDILNLRAMLAYAKPSIFKKLQQGINILSESIFNWTTKFSLGLPDNEQHSDNEACHMMLLSMDSIHICTKNPEITTLTSLEYTVETLRLLLANTALARNLKDKAVQIITGLMKIVDTIFQSSYYHYTDDLEERMTLNKAELIMVESGSKSFVRKKLIKDYMLSEKQRTAQRMKLLESSSSILIKSLNAVEKAMSLATTGRKLSVNRTFVSVLAERIKPLSIKNYSAKVGGINLELQADGNEQTDFNILIAAFKRSPFPILNDTSYSLSEVLVFKSNFSCNVTARLRNRNIPNLHKSTISIHSDLPFYQEFAVSMNDLTVINLEPENLMDSTNLELYIKGGARPTEVDFDIKFDIGKHQSKFKVPTGKLSNASKGYLMLKEKDKKDRRRKARDTRIKDNAERGVVVGTVGVQVFTLGCRARSFTSSSWITGGCKVGDETSVKTTVCNCPHTSGHQSAFTSTFYVQPNLIDHIDFSNFDVDNAAVYGTLIVMLCLYIILVMILRKQDHKDIVKWAPQFLCDNGENDVYFYMITVYTGMRRGAATMSNVNFILSGDEDDSGIRIMSGSSHSGFDAGSVRRFIASSKSNFGKLNYLRIWHDNSGPDNKKSWFLNKIIVDDLQTKARYIFHCGRWLSRDRDDGRTELVLPVCTTENLNSFNTRFSEQAQLSLTDSHLLVSTLIRPESSNFSRVQRGSCLFVLMLLTMISHAMYFKENNIVSASQVKIGSLNFSLKDLYVSLIVALITTPPILFASFVFKRTSKYSNHVSRISSRKRSTTSEKYTSMDTDYSNNIDLTSTFDTEKTLFPKWVLYFAWFLLFASAAVSSFCLLLYSMQWGKEKSTRWLVKFILSLLESIFIVDPGKIILMALMVALFLKNKETEYKLNVDVRHLRHLAKVFYSNYSGSLTVMRRQILGRHEPALPHDVENFKSRRHQEVKARGVFIELLTYGVFAFNMFSISYIHKDQRSFLLKQNVHNILVKDLVTYNKFTNINKTIDYFNWLNNTVLPHLYPSRDWSNNSLPPSPWVGDLVNIRVGTAKLRQVRVTEEPCISYLYHIVRPCIREYQDQNIETRDFYPYWRLENNLSRTPQALKRAWRYSHEDKGIDVPGEIHLYKPGGYIIMLPESLKEARDLVYHLTQYRWVDRHTRALFLELNLYNPNINIFTYAMFIAEFIETGGIVPWSNIWVFRPNEFTGPLGTYALLCYLIFLIFLCLGSFKIIKGFYQRRMKFLKQIWNLVDISCVVISYVGIVVFFVGLDKAKETIPKAKELSNDTFNGFQSVFLWDFSFNCIVAVLTFITTLRILRILGYNRRLTEIVRVITTSARDLIGFGLVFSIIYLAYVIFGFLIYGKSLSEYNTVFKSFGTLTNSLIGKNRLDMMIHVAPEAASFFYFTYTFCVILTLLTMFSAILNYSIRKVRHQSRKNPETYGIVDILSSTISNLFGMAMLLQRRDRAKEKITTKGEKHLRSEKINAVGIVQLIRDIMVQSLGEEFMRSNQDSTLKTTKEPSDLRINPLTPVLQNERLKGRQIGDVSKLERIGTLRDIEVSIDKREDNLVQRSLNYL
ncbi:uncharacterized protein LOC134243288 [Saccostrea cucullata]|uniref:uncharacterized protein LOC134243288 n=1 Tax=Saccostrea cuccullata TaxID=36930 RepID=UPI002ED1F568